MLFICLRASLVALVAYAATVSAAPSLTVKASTSDNVNGVRNLKVTTIVTNTCGETLKLLKDPRGVLNPFPGDSFVITNHAGSGPSFNGAMVTHRSICDKTCALMPSVYDSRPSTTPHTPPASMIPAFSPFSLLAVPSPSLTIVSGSLRSLLTRRASIISCNGPSSLRRIRLH